MGLGAAVDLFLAAKAAEGASPRTIEWYPYVNGRAVRRFGAERPLDRVGAPDLRAWLLELRATLPPGSVAGYVRGLQAFGNWWAAEELGTCGVAAASSGPRRCNPAAPGPSSGPRWTSSTTRPRRSGWLTDAAGGY